MRRARNEVLQRRLVEVGQRVRACRSASGMSQEALADAAGLHRTYIGSVERGERNVSLGNLYGLADALNVPVHRLLDDGVGLESSADSTLRTSAD